MKTWEIQYAEQAQEDLQDIYEYIAYSLLEPETAANQVRAIMKTISGLHEMPFRYPLFAEEPWHSKGLRMCTAGKYVIFYLPDESQNTVRIVRIMYGG
jgi:toxin ParE1/3/4